MHEYIIQSASQCDTCDTASLNYFQTKWNDLKRNESIFIDGKQDTKLFVSIKEYLLSKYIGYSKE